MRRFSGCMTLAASLLLALSSSVRADTTFTAYMDGSQETPPQQTDAAGVFTGTLNDDGTEFTFTVDWAGLNGGTVTGAHFHMGDVGVGGGIVRGYTAADFESPDGHFEGTWTAADSQALTPELLDALMNGLIYFNIHTQQHPGGEIRGQVYPDM